MSELTQYRGRLFIGELFKGQALVYKVKEVDALLAEKDKEIERLKPLVSNGIDLAHLLQEAERKLKVLKKELSEYKFIAQVAECNLTKATDALKYYAELGWPTAKEALADIEEEEKPNKNYTSASNRLSEAEQKANPWLEEMDWDLIETISQEEADLGRGMHIRTTKVMARAILWLRGEITK